MTESGKAGTVTLESLMNLPPIENEKQSSEEALKSQMAKDEEVLPGLEIKPIVEDPIEEIITAVDKVDTLLEIPGLEKQGVDSKKDNNVGAETVASKMYKDTIKSLWGDEVGSIIQEVDGEEKEIPLEDIELDEETFLNIFNSKLEEVKEAATRNKISAEGISEFTKNLIEIDRNGGNVRDLLEVKQKYSDPLEGLDLENPEDQKEVIFLRAKAAGQDDADINRLIRSYEAEGVLEEKSIEANNTLRAAIDAKVQQELKKAEDGKIAADAAFKEYKKDLKENLNQFELKDTIKTKLVDMATKKNKNNQYDIDAAYNERRMDPVKAARMALFLLDEEEFIKQVTKEAVQSKQLDTAKKLKIIPRSNAVEDPKRSPANNRSVNIADLT